MPLELPLLVVSFDLNTSFGILRAVKDLEHPDRNLQQVYRLTHVVYPWQLRHLIFELDVTRMIVVPLAILDEEKLLANLRRRSPRGVWWSGTRYSDVAIDTGHKGRPGVIARMSIKAGMDGNRGWRDTALAATYTLVEKALNDAGVRVDQPPDDSRATMGLTFPSAKCNWKWR